jgi:hypothetical protein
LQKILKQIDPEKLQQKSLEKAKGNKAGDKGAWPCCCRGMGHVYLEMLALRTVNFAPLK